MTLIDSAKKKQKNNTDIFLNTAHWKAVKTNHVHIEWIYT